jgi:hypothetical protein
MRVRRAKRYTRGMRERGKPADEAGIAAAFFKRNSHCYEQRKAIR